MLIRGGGEGLGGREGEGGREGREKEGGRERETLLGNRVQKVAPVWQGRERQHKINTKTTQRQHSSVWCLSTDCYSLLVISVTQTLSS